MGGKHTVRKSVKSFQHDARTHRGDYPPPPPPSPLPVFIPRKFKGCYTLGVNFCRGKDFSRKLHSKHKWNCVFIQSNSRARNGSAHDMVTALTKYDRPITLLKKRNQPITNVGIEHQGRSKAHTVLKFSFIQNLLF